MLIAVIGVWFNHYKSLLNPAELSRHGPTGARPSQGQGRWEQSCRSPAGVPEAQALLDHMNVYGTYNDCICIYIYNMIYMYNIL